MYGERQEVSAGGGGLNVVPGGFGNLPEPAGRELFEVDRLLKESGLLRLSRKGLNLWAVEGQPSFFVPEKR